MRPSLMRCLRIAALAGLLVGCRRSPRETTESTEPDASVIAAPPQVDQAAIEKDAIAKATTSWVALNKIWQGVSGVVNAKKTPGPCRKAVPPVTASGSSIGAAQVADLAKPGAPHNYLFDGGGTTSEKLSEIFKIPFLEREHASRDWAPAKASAKLQELQTTLFPLVVLRIDDFVPPELTGPKTFRPGHASTTVFFFETPTEVCSFRLTTQSGKSISALTLDGETGGRDIVNARFANELEQTVQREAGAKLVGLGKLGLLEPVVRGR
jgi:hypothetical protein